MKLLELLNKKKLTKEDLIYLLSQYNSEKKDFVYQEASRIKSEYFGNKIHLRGIIEFSNYCRQDCYYCGIRNENEEIYFINYTDTFLRY